jgi:ActD protein
MIKPAGLYGLMAEFTTPEELVAAAASAHRAGYRRMDGYTPYAVDGLAEALGFHRNRLPLVVLIGGILGGLGAFFMQYYLSVIDYPINVGGRPFNSWPSFIPVTFELTILGAAFAAVLGMLGLNGLPMPYHPVFNAPLFELATRNRFFLCIQADDARFQLDETWRFLESLGPGAISEVSR